MWISDLECSTLVRELSWGFRSDERVDGHWNKPTRHARELRTTLKVNIDGSGNLNLFNRIIGRGGLLPFSLLPHAIISSSLFFGKNLSMNLLTKFISSRGNIFCDCQLRIEYAACAAVASSRPWSVQHLEFRYSGIPAVPRQTYIFFDGKGATKGVS